EDAGGQSPQAITWAAPGVLWNDVDIDKDPLQAVLVAGPSNAMFFELHTDGSFVYMPKPGFQGEDGFTSRPSAGFENGDVSTVNISVVQREQPHLHVPVPVLQDDVHNLDHRFSTSGPPGDVFYGELVPSILNNDVDMPLTIANGALQIVSENIKISPFDLEDSFADRTLDEQNFVISTLDQNVYGQVEFSYAVVVGSRNGHKQLSNFAAVKINILDRDSDGDGVLDSVEG